MGSEWEDFSFPDSLRAGSGSLPWRLAEGEAQGGIHSSGQPPVLEGPRRPSNQYAPGHLGSVESKQSAETTITATPGASCSGARACGQVDRRGVFAARINQEGLAECVTAAFGSSKPPGGAFGGRHKQTLQGGLPTSGEPSAVSVAFQRSLLEDPHSEIN